MSDSEPQFSSRIDWIKTPSVWFKVSVLLFLALGVAFAAARAYKNYAVPDGTFEFSDAGMSDFHNGGYYPSLAFREGVNPYSLEVCDQYPVSRPSASYSPIVFILHMPFSYLSLGVADVVFFGVNLALIGLIAWFGFSMSGVKPHWSHWIGILGLLVISRPGHISLYTGYFTAMLVIGTLMAVHFADRRPVLAGLGMMLASGKPTYILPLIVLMLCRRNFKAVVIGLVFCTIAGVAGLGWLSTHSSVGDVLQAVQEGQSAHHDDTTEDPVNTWTRLDLVGIVSKIMAWKPGNGIYFASMLLLLIPPGIILWKTSPLESNRGANGLTGMIVMLVILISIYHHSYDCLLVVVAWIGIAFFGHRILPEAKRFERRLLVVLLGIPAINYFATMKFRGLFEIENQTLLWNTITSLNGASLLVSLLILFGVSVRMIKKERLAGL